MTNLYMLTTTPKSAAVIRKSLRVYLKMSCGDFSYLLTMRNKLVGGAPVAPEAMEEVRALLTTMAAMLFNNALTPSEESMASTTRNTKALLSKIRSGEALDTGECRTVSVACEVLARLQVGQIRTAVEYLPTSGYWSYSSRVDNMWDVDARIKKLLFGLDPSTSLGVGHREASWEKDVAFSTHMVIRHRLSWDERPEGGMTVNFDRPMNWYSKVPLVVITKVDL